MKTLNSQLLEGVDVLAAVVDTKSFGRAAEALDMSQSGVSRVIARLETRLGIRVFERTTRNVRLTEAGRNFYEQVMPLVGALAEVTNNAAGNASKVQGRLRVNVDPLFASLVLGPRLGDFMDRHPDLEIELRCRDELGDLVGEGYDLALRFGHPPASSLIARKLFDTRVLAMASPAYLKRHGHPKEPKALETGGHRCLLFREPLTGKPFSWEFHQGRKKLMVHPHGSLMVNDPSVVLSTCIAGMGIAQMFELGMAPYIASKQLVPLFPDWSDHRFPLYVYYPTRHHVPAKTRALLDFVDRLVR
ncbi:MULTISPECIES: LysR family transcriptional regulator [Pandoraea]|uniref:LysR family transcriptional regulator n=1 Tax=Pandoraea TaxID=93217 RepID=UPI001F5C48FA|nr:MULTISPECIES: LysR family transcriptional regulator [Pandoraea]MCI3205962.1 LysR family transcriptional regulator [Pandoraea sp. LA3]MDN4583990.1 LysR family transcriptional regulator [Pandoraea capi]